MIVMKFGGTSVEDVKAIEQAAAIVRGRLVQKPVVVVSAMAKVTDQLLAMARAAGVGDRKTALKLCRALQERLSLSDHLGQFETAGRFSRESAEQVVATDQQQDSILGRRHGCRA